MAAVCFVNFQQCIVVFLLGGVKNYTREGFNKHDPELFTSMCSFPCSTRWLCPINGMSNNRSVTEHKDIQEQLGEHRHGQKHHSNIATHDSRGYEMYFAISPSMRLAPTRHSHI